jgi:hypothetical protein
MGYGFASVEKTTGYSIATVEEYTLQDLGGLDTAITISGAGDGIGPAEPDFVWFGIIERMKESTILFTIHSVPNNTVQSLDKTCTGMST